MPKKKKYKQILIEIDPPEYECSCCKKKQPITEFRYFELTDHWTKMCATCRERNAQAQREYRERFPEDARERGSVAARKWREENPEIFSLQVRRSQQKQKLRLSKLPEEERRKIYRKAYRRRISALRADPERYEKHRQRALERYRQRLAKLSKRKRKAHREKVNARERERRAERKNDPVAYAKHLKKQRHRLVELKKDPAAYQAHLKERRAKNAEYRAKKRKD